MPTKARWTIAGVGRSLGDLVSWKARGCFKGTPTPLIIHTCEDERQDLCFLSVEEGDLEFGVKHLVSYFVD